jgi:hypothetical protein
MLLGQKKIALTPISHFDVFAGARAKLVTATLNLCYFKFEFEKTKIKISNWSSNFVKET